ncbi:hypothetical protein C0J52_04917 [Blattella germanica]|nr:hypothetical protein C0J52_04917 [Blattella germanica]
MFRAFRPVIQNISEDGHSMMAQMSGFKLKTSPQHISGRYDYVSSAFLLLIDEVTQTYSSIRKPSSGQNIISTHVRHDDIQQSNYLEIPYGAASCATRKISVHNVLYAFPPGWRISYHKGERDDNRKTLEETLSGKKNRLIVNTYVHKYRVFLCYPTPSQDLPMLDMTGVSSAILGLKTKWTKLKLLR